MVELKSVIFSREGRAILDRVSFTIGTTERVALLGESGAGKTTILKLIMGLERPDSGAIMVDGEDITQMHESQLRTMRLKFAIVFQEGALFDSLSVKDNVAFYLHEHTTLTEREVDAHVNTMLSVVGLREAADLMPENLSGGMKRRAAIARALVAQEPTMFLYDEPTSDLDPVNAEIICRLMLELSGKSKGFLMVTHEILYALAVANRFIFLHNGVIAFEGGRQALLDPDNTILQAFIGHLYWQAVHSSPDAFVLQE